MKPNQLNFYPSSGDPVVSETLSEPNQLILWVLLSFTDDLHRRLAVKGKPVGRKGLVRFASTVTPQAMMAP